jgi:hypothetical protein
LILAVTFAVTKAGDTADSISAPATSTPAATTPTPSTGTTAAPAKPKQPALEAGAGLPGPVARALNDGKVVVLFFYEPAASDDQATRAAVRAVRAGAGSFAGTRVRLFQDTVSRISDYRRVVGSLGISHSPAMVIIDRNRKAELLQGFVDSGTIQQTVRDAL